MSFHVVTRSVIPRLREMLDVSPKPSPIVALSVFIGLQVVSACAQDVTAHRPRVLFFSKAASWEQKIVHRDHDRLSYIETAVDKLGRDNGIDFTFSKDGTIFTSEYLAKFDAVFFFTSGDLTFQQRNGRGDNYPLMTLEGKRAFLDAIDRGLGFVGCNTANYTFTEPWSPGEKKEDATAARYTRMLGSGYMGHNEVQPGAFTFLDRSFPGMEHVPPDYRPVDQWYAFNRLMPDLHVIMALDAPKLTGNLYQRAPYPVAWARLQGKGRIFYTTMGHTAEIWQSPVFLQMLLGGIRWAAHVADANVTPNLTSVTPQANEIPASASKFVASRPPVDNPHFPNFKVWLDQDFPMETGPRVLVYTKSAGDEPALVYRDTAWPSPLESILLEFGREHHIHFVFTKDGAFFTPENLARFDSILFLASGDPTDQPRDGRGDNYPLLPEEAIEALMKAVREGKGFMNFHSSLRARREGSAIQPLIALVGANPWWPAVWTRLDGKGRTFATLLGDREITWKNPAFQQLLLGAIRWTAHRELPEHPAAHQPTFADLATPRTPVPGAPNYGDVIVRNLRPHPAPGRVPDPYESLRMIQAFHVTRLEWTYQLDAAFVQKLKAMGLTVGGAIEDDPGSRSRLGRVTGQDGTFVTHKWFPKDRLVGCANAPEFRAAWLEEARRSIDAGADLMQQDDPQMALRTDPPLCYCRYCQEAFAKYRATHGPAASYEDFQKESILEFHRDMHRALDAYAGRHIPFSHNGAAGLSAKGDWVAPAFDFVNVEIEGKNTEPASFLPIVAAARGTPLVFSHRERDVDRNRRFLALTYATGAWMMLPWDVYMPGNQPRYFGAAADYGDLSGFIRASKTYLDGYEAASSSISDGPTEDHSLAIESGSGNVFALARARPGMTGAPVIIHIVDYAAEPQPLILKVRAASLGLANVGVRLRAPKPYDAAQHARAQETQDFSSLASETPMTFAAENGWLRLSVPAPHPWEILVIFSRQQ
jgi:hypothetical protein